MDDGHGGDHDPEWFVVPCIGTFLAVFTAPVVYVVLGMSLFAISDACAFSCEVQRGYWRSGLICAWAALPCAAAVWVGPHTLRWRKVRLGAVVAMEALALAAIALALVGAEV